MAVIVRSRVFSFLCSLCLLLGFTLLPPWTATGQIRLAPVPPSKSQAHTPVHPQDLITTALQLNLCVDGSSEYPCPTPITSDGTYIPMISLTYGQVLDGVVVYGPADLTTGTITIYKDADVICTLAIGIDHTCPPNTTLFDVGNYTLTATLTFPANSLYADSTAAPVMISIAKDTSSIALKSSASPAALGTPVSFTATVTGGYTAIPTGQAVFTVDGTPAPPVNLDATGAATLITSTLALGFHTITASYTGATDFLPAPEDATFKQQIVPPATVTTIASSLNPSTVGENVTFTSTVATAVTGLGVIPTGSVTFKDGTASFATVPVKSSGNQNVVQTTTATLAFGTHSITAIYSGDAATSASVSKVLVQQVEYPLTQAPPGYKITVTPASLTLFAGASTKLNVTVTPVSGFSGAVTLSCTNLPNESACTFDEVNIHSGGGSTTLELTTMFPHDCGSDVPYGGFGSVISPPALFACTAPSLAGLFVLIVPTKRRRTRSIKLLSAIAAVFALASLTACGGRCTDFGTSPGNYTFKVVGTAPATVSTTTSTTNPSTTPTVSTSVSLSIKP